MIKKVGNMRDIKRFLALFIALCLTCTCVMPAWAETDYSSSERTSELIPEQIEEYPDYVEGNVIVCVKGGAAALSAAMSGTSGESRQRRMLKASVREFTFGEVLASFDTPAEGEAAPQTEPEAAPEVAAEPEAEPAAAPEVAAEPEAEPARPLLFSALKPLTASVNADYASASVGADSASAPTQSAEEQEKEEILLLHAADTESLIAKLEALPCVVYAQPDYIYQTEALDASDYGKKEPFYFAQTNLENADGGCDIDASEAWEAAASAGSETQVIAIMDTGVDYNHPDLKDVMWNDGLEYPALVALGGGEYGINTSSEGATDDPNDYYVGHGTHCASIIASAWNNEGTAGVGGNIRIMACCWLGALGGKASDYVKAANYVIKAKEAGVNVTVANNSWGSSLRFIYNSPVQNDLAIRMGEAGIANVFAAGNDSRDIDSNQQNTHIRTDTTLIVGASDSNGECAVFSNYGKKNVDVFAPGVNILAAASLSPDNYNMQPQYLPWLDPNDSIMFCNMENTDEICVKAGQSEEIESMDILPEIATPSVANMQLYGYKDNQVIEFDTDYASGENGFDLELKLTDSQAEEALAAKNLYVAFQIARDADKQKDDMNKSQPMLWNNAKGEFEAVIGSEEETPVNPVRIFIDPAWNYVSFSFSPKNNPDFIDEEGRIRLRFLNSQEEKGSVKQKIYIDNVGISLEPSEYTYSSGASMACPMAVGVLAMIIGKLQAEDSAQEKTNTEIIKEAIAYLKGGVLKQDALEGKCITGGVINAARSLKGVVSPVVDEIKNQGDGTSIIRGYFFGSTAGSVTIEGTEANVVYWDDRTIQIENVDIERSRAEIIVKNKDEHSGRTYADYGEDSEGYVELAPLPVVTGDMKLCAAGDTILCFIIEENDVGESIVKVWKYDLSSEEWSRVEIPGNEIQLLYQSTYEIAVAAGESEIYFLSSLHTDNPEDYSLYGTPKRLLTYDTTTDTWKYDVVVDVKSYSAGTLCVYDGELILFGLEEENASVRKIYPDTGEVYEAIEGVPLEYCSGYSFQVGEDILAAGMINGLLDVIIDGMFPGVEGRFREIIRYDSNEESWQESEAIFFGDDSEWLDEGSWRQCSAVPLKDGLMIVGPVKNNGESNMTDTWIYKASGDTYEAYPAAFDTMRTKNVASCLLDGKMYVLGITSMEEKAGTMRFSVLDISEIAADAYPNAKKSPKKPDPKPTRRSSGYDPLWNGKPVKTGTQDDPVSGGVWTMDYNGVWSYHTNAYFRNTWGYIVNPYAKDGQHQADWFWFDEYGKMLTGWQFIGGKWYYLNPDKDGTLGACFMGPGRTPDGYEVDETGAWTGR